MMFRIFSRHKVPWDTSGGSFGLWAALLEWLQSYAILEESCRWIENIYTQNYSQSHSCSCISQDRQT
jgi:hypothetical protein